MLTNDSACELCGCVDFITDIDNGEEVCVNCGYVVNDLVYSRVKKPNHNESTGTPSFAYYSKSDYMKKTTIYGTKDAYGVPLDDETMEKMRRLQRSDNYSKFNDNIDRNLNAAMAELDRLCTVLNLPMNVKERSAFIYRKALACDLIRGRSIDAFVAASIYAACRLMNVPRLLKTVSELSKRDMREVGKTYRFLLRELKIKPPLDSPFKYIPRIVTETGAPRVVEIKAIELINNARNKHVLMGKDPMGIAGAAVLLASELEGVQLVQKNVADASDVTNITLRSRYRSLRKALNIDDST